MCLSCPVRVYVSVQFVFQVTDPNTSFHIFQFTSQPNTPVAHPSLPAQFIYPVFPQTRCQFKVAILTLVGHFVALSFPALLCPAISRPDKGTFKFINPPLSLCTTDVIGYQIPSPTTYSSLLTPSCLASTDLTIITFTFSHLADTLFQSDLQ